MIIEPLRTYTRDPNVERYMVDHDVEMLLHPEWDFPMFVRKGDEVISIPEDRDFQQMEEHHPWVAGHPCGRDGLSQGMAAFGFLSLCRKQRSLNAGFRACCIKDHAEDVTNINISDGSFIRAALLAGFAVKRVDDSGPCQMNIVTDDSYFDLFADQKRARRTVQMSMKQERLAELEKEAHANDHLWRRRDHLLSGYERTIAEFAGKAVAYGRGQDCDDEFDYEESESACKA